MTFDKETQAALAADGDKLRSMTGEDHGQQWIYEDELPESYPYDEMFQHSKVYGVRMFPAVAPKKTISIQDVIEMAAKIAEEDRTPGYGTHKSSMEWLAEAQRKNIAERIRQLASRLEVA